MSNSKKQILIAHQSTIPHYRVAFYEAVERLRPRWWEFTVMYDKEEADNFFYLSSNINNFNFRIKETKSYTLNILGRRLIFQTFPFTSMKYDLLVVGNAMNNIAYPISFIRKLFGKPIAYWGHGRDVFTLKKSLLKKMTDGFKMILSNLADGFFAYTEGVKKYLIQGGITPNKIFPLYNTINIEEKRKEYELILPDREALRIKMGVNSKKVLLMVGRLTKERRMEFFLESYKHLLSIDKSYKLFIIGGGNKKIVEEFQNQCGKEFVEFLGVVPDDEIAKYYIVSDLFVYPGSVGLAPLQALCYNLIPIVIDSDTHSPEFEYLNKNNSIILPKNTDAREYANTIKSFLENKEELIKIQNHAWDSIKHLTIENMAKNFISGINFILDKERISSSSYGNKS